MDYSLLGRGRGLGGLASSHRGGSTCGGERGRKVGRRMKERGDGEEGKKVRCNLGNRGPKLYRKISPVCCRLYCYECTARAMMPTATNE